jgi:acyl-CoA synthetase (AMP-forming)/AMP-acid ligase II
LNNASPKIYLQTSESTGNPKMATHLHTKLMGNAFNCVERLGLTSEDRIAIPVPIFHMYGLAAAFLPGVVVGASIDLQKKS